MGRNAVAVECRLRIAFKVRSLQRTRAIRSPWRLGRAPLSRDGNSHQGTVVVILTFGKWRLRRSVILVRLVDVSPMTPDRNVAASQSDKGS
jgi:hypothetical protein